MPSKPEYTIAALLPDITIPYRSNRTEPTHESCLICGRNHNGKKRWVQLDKSLKAIEDPVASESGGLFPIVGSCWVPELEPYRAKPPFSVMESRSGRKSKELSARQISLIRAGYESGDLEELAKKVDMTVSGLRFHAYKLGVKRPRKKKNPVAIETVVPTNTPYSEAEIAFIIEHFDSRGAGWVAKELGRTRASVASKMRATLAKTQRRKGG